MVSSAPDGAAGKKVRQVAQTAGLAATLAAGLSFAPMGSAVGQTAYDPQQQSGQTTAFGQPVDPAATSTADPTATGSTTDPALLVPASDEQLAADDQADIGRENLRQAPVDEGRTSMAPDGDATGIRLGTMTLRPSITQGLQYERTKTGSASQSSSYSETQLKGSLTSDWSRHQLTVNGSGTIERLLSGDGDEGTSVGIDAELRLDISRATTATITGGYDFSRADADDDDAVANAETQYGIHRFDGGAALEHDFGRLRGTVGLSGSRWIYTDATLEDGTSVSLADRDRSQAQLRMRLGYELSPALIPFLEASIARLQYDQKTDGSGYERSAGIYAGKLGVAADFRDKLRGELSFGYTTEKFDDARLEELSALTIDGSLGWSPRYGTDVTLGLSTSLDPSSSAGTSGAVVYATNASISQQLRDRLVATLTSEVAWTKYPNAEDDDKTAYTIGTGLSYELNRYLALSAGLEYEYTARASSTDSETVRATVGVTAKR